MQPFKFLPNRVKRSYTGGSGIDRIRGNSDCADSDCPEEWIASTVQAASAANPASYAGLSIIDDKSRTYFRDFLHTHAQTLLGKRHIAGWGAQTGFLMKLLDSAIRLPVQVHPSRAFAREHLNSQFGKNEAWYVVATRATAAEEPYLLVGFNERLDPDIYIRESLAGELKEGLQMLHRIAVKPGDAYMIPAGTPHAIGPNLTMIEIMEPSDAIVISEGLCGNIILPEQRRFNGLPPQRAMTMYDFTPLSLPQLLQQCRRTPVREDECATLIFDRNREGYFGLRRVIIDGQYTLGNKEGIGQAGIVLAGSVRVTDVRLTAGDAFFLPAEIEQYGMGGKAEIILAQPPLADGAIQDDRIDCRGAESEPGL